jgi:hypothetical protein
LKPGDKDYIGDGVYVVWDGFTIILTTENGIETTNEIFIEPAVWEALKDYVARLGTAASAEQEKKP